MTSESINWDEDLPAEPEEEISAFVRTLERTEGFRLLFVQCTPVEGEQLITRVREDLPKKTIEVLRFDEPIDNLYEIVKNLPNREQINILFIQGLEHSLYEYEQTKFGEKSERFAYSWKGIPKILNHLNLHRERFRDTFNICFVFLLRSFSLKYFIHRAPDFFDWRSSIFEFPTNPELLEQESSRLLDEGDYEKYLSLTRQQKIQKILEIEELLEEKHQTLDKKAELLGEQGKLLFAAQEYEAALKAFDKAVEFKPDKDEAWYNRGYALGELGRLEEAIASYDKATEFKPDYHQAWNNRGIVLGELERLEEALASYDKAVEFKPDYHQAWNNRGNALGKLGRLEEVVTSYDKAVEIKPDYHQAWNNRGIALGELGRLEKAVASYDKAVEFKPDDHKAWNNRGIVLGELERLEEALASYDKAVEFKPDKDEAWYNRGNALGKLGRLEEAIASYDKAVEIKPDFHQAWYNRGNALGKLERLEEAIASYDKAVELKPDFHQAWYNKARYYALQNNIEQAIENLQIAINLNLEECREMAKTDRDFDTIRDKELFQKLIYKA